MSPADDSVPAGPSADHPGARLRAAIPARGPLPFIGIYDVFSASLAARHFDALFLSGFGFAASHYGLPDIGFIAWPDIVALARRIRTVLPRHHLLVDIDDGYGDPEIACHVVAELERAGVSAVVLEDQRRPRKCGHFDGKQVLDLEEYLLKLKRVLATRRDLLVVARTDSTDPDDVARRVRAFAAAGADAVLVDGLRDLSTVRALAGSIDAPFAFNQISGGKSPPCTLSELRQAGVSLVIYSTPCLFPVQEAIDRALTELRAADGLLPPATPPRVGVKACTDILRENLARRDDG